MKISYTANVTNIQAEEHFVSWVDGLQELKAIASCQILHMHFATENMPAI
jgi:hypothetical protein